jgi:hypothetical protein
VSEPGAVGDQPAHFEAKATEGDERDQAFIRPTVILNGARPGPSLHCTLLVFDEGSEQSRATGSCFSDLATVSRAGDVAAELEINGFRKRERLATQPFPVGVNKVKIEITWPLGRVKIAHDPRKNPAITSCRVAYLAAGEKDQAVLLAGADTTFFVMPAGTYDAKLTCNATVGNETRQVEALVPGVTVSAAHDTWQLVGLGSDTETAPAIIAPQTETQPVSQPNEWPMPQVYGLPGRSDE